MNWFLNLSMRVKLMFCFGCLIVLLAIVASVAYSGFSRIDASRERLFNVEVQNAIDLNEVRALQTSIRGDVLTLLLEQDKTASDKANKRIDEVTDKVQTILARLKARNQEDSYQKEHLQEFYELQKAYRDTRINQVMPLIAAGKLAEAKLIVMGAQANRMNKLADLANQLVTRSQQILSQGLNENRAMVYSAIQLFIMVFCLAVILAIAFAYVLGRILANPLRSLTLVSEQIAQGDLTVEVQPMQRSDEIGILVNNFGLMTRKLRQVMTELNEGVNVLASSATEITASTTQVASGSAETAAAVNQTTTTVEEVKQTSEVAVEKAKYVADLAQKSVHISESGRKSMEESIEAMQQIREQVGSIAEGIVRLSEQSQDISEIIATVNDLAEQSNLLAVNASIEAAKAGEQGKGFSVVAQEVKSMAAQSKAATTQVRSILGEVQKAMAAAVMATEQGSKIVESGVRLSTETGEAIRILADSIAESSQAVTQIMSSSQQQLVGMDQVTQAMQNINQASIQNVSSTKQAEVAAHELHHLGQKLKEMVNQYRL